MQRYAALGRDNDELAERAEARGGLGAIEEPGESEDLAAPMVTLGLTYDSRPLWKRPAFLAALGLGALILFGGRRRSRREV